MISFIHIKSEGTELKVIKLIILCEQTLNTNNRHMAYKKQKHKQVYACLK